MNVPMSVIDSPTQVFCIYFYFMITSNNNLSEFNLKEATAFDTCTISSTITITYQNSAQKEPQHLMIPYNITHYVIVIRATYVRNTNLYRSMLLEECSRKVYQSSPCTKMIFYPKNVLAYIFLVVYFSFSWYILKLSLPLYFKQTQ